MKSILDSLQSWKRLRGCAEPEEMSGNAMHERAEQYLSAFEKGTDYHDLVFSMARLNASLVEILSEDEDEEATLVNSSLVDDYMGSDSEAMFLV